MASVPVHLLRGGERWRAPYACDPARSRGRMHKEEEDPLRSPFQRDRDRIVHCNAFRRLKHKTQVFVRHEGDHFRTRLTHTLEVAQIARSIARPLGLDEDLTEALALGHDLGHPPFGHAGERALDQAMAAFDGFDHNAQSLRVITVLERRYAAFHGLNPTWECLEGLAKHNGPLVNPRGEAIGANAGRPLPYGIRAVQQAMQLELDAFASMEAQVAAISDDIAYDCHDLEDGLRAGLLELSELEQQAATGPILRSIYAAYSPIEPARAVYELIRRMIGIMIADVLCETARRIDDFQASSSDDVRRAGAPLVGFSAAFASVDHSIKAFLLERVYRSEQVMRPVRLAEGIIADLFGAFLQSPGAMPGAWGQGLSAADETRIARRIADYIAGMTDRYALGEHHRLFDATPDLG